MSTAGLCDPLTVQIIDAPPHSIPVCCKMFTCNGDRFPESPDFSSVLQLRLSSRCNQIKAQRNLLVLLIQRED